MTEKPNPSDGNAPLLGARPDGAHSAGPRIPKELPDLAAAFDACGITDGAVLSFHHHLRDGDATMAQVLEVAAERGLRDLGIAASSIFPCQSVLAEHIRSGLVRRVWTSYVKGPAADAITEGALRETAVIQTHGGRARAIGAGEIIIDAAFIAAPVSDRFGALTGAVGRAACGPLGYPQVDARAARCVVGVVEEVWSDPLPKTEIPADDVDHIVRVERIGDPSGILSGATRLASDAAGLRIADLAAEAIVHSGLMKPGFSFQTGAGGISLAAAVAIGRSMRERAITGSFISGGIGAPHVALARSGLFEEIIDVQAFDLEGVTSYAEDRWHRCMSAAEYASPLHPNPVTDRLDVMVLGAAEIDRAFNINVVTASDGRIIGGPGGHPDTAEGAKLTVATTKLTAGGYPKVVDRVDTVTTEGAHVDVLVTDEGIAVNPRRGDLEDRLSRAGLPLQSIDTLVRLAGERATKAASHGSGPVVAIVENRHGKVVDTIRRRQS